MTTYRRVTCVLINDSETELIATGKTLNYKITQGALLGSMPCPVAANSKGTFVLSQTQGTTVGPSGWACYEIANELVFQIGFGDPALGASAFSIGFNYLAKNLQGVGAVKFAGPSGPIEPSKVAETMDLTVEYHLDTKPVLQVATDPPANAGSSQVVAAPPNAAASIVVVPYIARWNQKAQGDQKEISQRRKKVLAAIYAVYPLLWESTSVPSKAVAPENGGGTYKHQGPWKSKGTSCTSSCPMVANKVSPNTSNNWNFQGYKQKPGWIQWGDASKKMPSVGDVYILVRDEVVRPIVATAPSKPRPPKPEKGKPSSDPVAAAEWSAYDSKVALHNPHQRHVGIVVEVPTDPSQVFITADGGQTAYGVQAAHLVKRAWSKRKPGPTATAEEKTWKQYMESKDFTFAKPKDYDQESIYLTGGAESKSAADGNRLVGWIDIDLIPDKDFNEVFDGDASQDAYEKLGAMIDKMR